MRAAQRRHGDQVLLDHVSAIVSTQALYEDLALQEQ